MLFAQCDYYEDPNAFRVNGAASAPTNYWNPGTANTANSNPPANLTSFMDADFTTIPPQGIFTRKYYESSFS